MKELVKEQNFEMNEIREKRDNSIAETMEMGRILKENE